jgi:probable phosphoglycerate mutase
LTEEKIVYLIRHGETDYNLKGIVQGSGVDASLNETGRQQSEAFFQKYKHIPFKKIYISSLKRTFETVSSFISLGIPFERHSGLNEISWGDKDGKIVNSDDQEYYRQIIDCWKRGETDRCIEGGESPEDVQNRQRSVLEHILSRPEENLILICMHGRAMRVLLATLLHERCLKNMDRFEHQNTCLYILKFVNEKVQIEKSNDISHLLL